jgi:hypothetical protein
VDMEKTALLIVHLPLEIFMDNMLINGSSFHLMLMDLIVMLIQAS